MFTLPEDADEGTYTVIVGQGDIVDNKTFEVVSGTSTTLLRIELNKTQINLKVGQEFKLEVKAVYGDKSKLDVSSEASYVSDNEEVATVCCQGKITAIKEGKANIKVTYEGKEASCIVNVTEESSGNGGSGGGGGNQGGSKTEEPEVKEQPQQPQQPQQPELGRKTFEDIANYPWAKEAIETLATLGIIKGTSETTFEPGKNITRADFITLLVRTLKLTGEVVSNFDDVQQGLYYYEPIGIAKQLGIVQGVGDNKFNPTANITRQDLMVMVARALKLTNKITTTGTFEDIQTFNDASQVASYAIEGVATLIKEGIVQGTTDNLINPHGNATRAETAVIVYRIYNKYILAE